MVVQLHQYFLIYSYRLSPLLTFVKCYFGFPILCCCIPVPAAFLILLSGEMSKDLKRNGDLCWPLVNSSTTAEEVLTSKLINNHSLLLNSLDSCFVLNSAAKFRFFRLCKTSVKAETLLQVLIYSSFLWI